MFEDLRARAGLLCLGVIAFLLLISQIPRWDSGWVQAIGSIAAIMSGFAYIAIQNHLARREARERQKLARQHVFSLINDILRVYDERYEIITQILNKGGTMTATSSRDPLDLASDELLLITPESLGSAHISTHVRKAGFWTKNVVYVTATAAGEGGARPIMLAHLAEAHTAILDARDAIQSAISD